jgi:hypothetical protein
MKYIYGKENDAYDVLPEDLNVDGYKLLSTPENASGRFAKEKIVVEFVYEDRGVSLPPTHLNPKSASLNSAFVSGQKIILTSVAPSQVSLYNLSGIKEKELYMAGGVEIMDATCLRGVYLVRFVDENRNVQTVKLAK